MSGAALLLKGCRRPVVQLSLASTMQCRCVFPLSVHRTRPIALRVASTVQEHSGAVQRNVRMAHDFEKRLDFLMDSLVENLSPGVQGRVRAAAADGCAPPPPCALCIVAALRRVLPVPRQTSPLGALSDTY